MERRAVFFQLIKGSSGLPLVCFATFTGRNLRGGKQEVSDTEVESSTKSASARGSAHSTDLIRVSRQSGSRAEVVTRPVTRASGGKCGRETGDGSSGGRAGGSKSGGGTSGGGGGSAGKSGGKSGDKTIDHSQWWQVRTRDGRWFERWQGWW